MKNNHYCPGYFLMRVGQFPPSESFVPIIFSLLFFSRKEAKESPSDAGLPKFNRKNRAKTKPRLTQVRPGFMVFFRTIPRRFFLLNS